MPALDLTLGLGIIGRAAHMLYAAITDLFGEVSGYVARPIVAEQLGLVLDMSLAIARGSQRQFGHVGDVLGLHRAAMI